PWPLLALLPLLAGTPTGPAPAAPPAPSCATALAEARSSQARLLAAAQALDVLLLGEIHTSSADHAWQLASLRALVERRPRLALGLEMVPAARQAALDRFSAGRSDEATLLKEVGWAEVWGHDPELYLPLLRWARSRGVPLLALNAEPELVRRVRQLGLAAAQPPGIGPPAPVGPAYRQRLTAAWQGHRAGGRPRGGAAAAGLGRVIDSQRQRARGLAEAIAAAHRRDPGRLVVALVGRGHLEGGDGVPRQLQALGLGRVAAALRPELPAGCEPAPAGVRLGAYLESADGAVWVRQVAPGSAAAAAGLRPGDRVLAVNGEAVQRAGQVIRRVAAQPAGVPLRLSIERRGRRLELEVPLAPPPERPAGRMAARPSPRP
ncbi:MAG: ChaN family lipoprotein, partial [Prochlorococcaceae cyanobacterium]